MLKETRIEHTYCSEQSVSLALTMFVVYERNHKILLVVLTSSLCLGFLLQTEKEGDGGTSMANPLYQDPYYGED